MCASAHGQRPQAQSIARNQRGRARRTASSSCTLHTTPSNAGNHKECLKNVEEVPRTVQNKRERTLKLLLDSATRCSRQGRATSSCFIATSRQVAVSSCSSVLGTACGVKRSVAVRNQRCTHSEGQQLGGKGEQIGSCASQQHPVGQTMSSGSNPAKYAVSTSATSHLGRQAQTADY